MREDFDKVFTGEILHVAFRNLTYEITRLLDPVFNFSGFNSSTFFTIHEGGGVSPIAEIYQGNSLTLGFL